MFFAFLRDDSHWPGLARLFGRPRCAQSDAPGGGSPTPCHFLGKKRGLFFSNFFSSVLPLGKWDMAQE